MIFINVDSQGSVCKKIDGGCHDISRLARYVVVLALLRSDGIVKSQFNPSPGGMGKGEGDILGWNPVCFTLSLQERGLFMKFSG